MQLLKALAEAGMIAAYGEGRRLIFSGAVKVNGTQCIDPLYEPEEGEVITVGKNKKFVFSNLKK